MARKHISLHLRVAILGLAISAAVSSAGLASDAAKEISVAAEQASAAATAADIKTIRAHLHETINCLVGPNSDWFDAKQPNPCKDLGSGAIPETTDPAKTQTLHAAFVKAKAGLTAHRPADAQAIAAEVEALLKKAM
jgi:type II secretory pathway pseudopilin PulG